MAVSDHLGLYLPTRDDYISVKRDLSDNYEIIDAAVFGNSQAIAKVQDEIGKVVNGNSCAGYALNKGDYVIVKNSTITGVADGLYTYSSSTSKSAGDAVSAGELTAVSGGIANELNSKIAKLFVPGNCTNRQTTNLTVASQKEVYSSYTIPSDGFYGVYCNGTHLSLTLDGTGVSPANKSYFYTTFDSTTEIISPPYYYSQGQKLYYCGVGLSVILCKYD